MTVLLAHDIVEYSKRLKRFGPSPPCFLLSFVTSNQLIEALIFALPSTGDPSARRRVQRRRKSVYPPTAADNLLDLDIACATTGRPFPSAIKRTLHPTLLVIPILLVIVNNGEPTTRVWCVKHGPCLSTRDER